MKQADELFLQATVELAEGGRFTCAPNPPVGCLIVDGYEVIGRGYHKRSGGGHAEVEAIEDAGGAARVAGSTVYVSLEPCSFEGRTPACARTLVAAKVGRVVIGAKDPHPKVSGEGIRILQAAGIPVDLVELESATHLVEGYVRRVTTDRPFVRIKTASSIDGATALANGQSQWITSAAARADVQYWRARSDAIVTGIGTVLADDPTLNVRDDRFLPCRQPLRVVLDRNLRISPKAKVLQGDRALVVHACGVKPDVALPAQCVASDAGVCGVMQLLAQKGCNEVLVEAGATLVGSFARENIWDEWLFYLAPKLLGSSTRGISDFAIADLAEAVAGRVVAVEAFGPDLRVQVRRND